MSLSKPEIAVIGGGTGSFTLLQELKDVTEHLSAIVSMSDDGGSSGKLRDEFGVLPPGDVRQCLVALSDAPEVRDIFTYRFNKGVFKGHSLGNIILTAMSEANEGSMERAIEVTSSALRITGSVIPVTTKKHTLVMLDGDRIIHGEDKIDKHAVGDYEARVKLDPPAALNPTAGEAIARSDLVVIAPGSIYTSLLACLAVGGMREALQATEAKIVVVTNLVSTRGQTDNWHVTDYVNMYERYIGEGVVDHVLYNTAKPSDDLLAKYALDGEYPIRNERQWMKDMRAKAIGAPLVAKEVFLQDPNDTLIKRTLIRHDAAQVCRKLMSIFYE